MVDPVTLKLPLLMEIVPALETRYSFVVSTPPDPFPYPMVQLGFGVFVFVRKTKLSPTPELTETSPTSTDKGPDVYILESDLTSK